MTWANGAMLAFDTETTGTDPEQARIVTACAVTIEGPKLNTRQWVIDPGVDIPAQASAIHGVTTEHAREFGVQPVDALPEILKALTDAWAAGIPVIIMNAPYDLTVLDRDLHRYFETGLTKLGPVLDPRVIDKHLDEVVGYHRRGGRKLIDLAAHYQVKLEGAHTAEGDCLAAARIIWRIAKAYPAEIGERSLDELQGLQAWWHSEQCRSLQEYFDRKGQVEIVDSSWPMRVDESGEVGITIEDGQVVR